MYPWTEAELPYVQRYGILARSDLHAMNQTGTSIFSPNCCNHAILEVVKASQEIMVQGHSFQETYGNWFLKKGGIF